MGHSTIPPRDQPVALLGTPPRRPRLRNLFPFWHTFYEERVPRCCGSP